MFFKIKGSCFSKLVFIHTHHITAGDKKFTVTNNLIGSHDAAESLQQAFFEMLPGQSLQLFSDRFAGFR